MDTKRFENIFLLCFVLLCSNVSSSVLGTDTCSFENIPTSDTFDIYKFLGEWHKIKMSAHDETDTYTSMILHYFMTKERKLLMASRAFNGKTNICDDAEFSILDEISPGKYKIKIGVNEGLYQVVYTDYQYAITFYCSNLSADGQCSRQHINVAILSRYDSVTADMLTTLENIIQRICVIPSMTESKPGLCDLTDDYLIANGYVGWGNGSAYRCDSQRISDRIPVYSGFELDQFLGEWHGAVTTLYRYGWKTQTEENLVFFLDENNELVLTVRGNDTTGQCSKPMVLKLEEEVPGKYLVHMTTGTGKFQVIFTDNQYAITYSCSKVNSEGHCERRYENFAIITRDNPVLESRMRDLDNYLTNFCVNIQTDIRKQIVGSCTVSKPFMAKYGFYKGCPVQNIPVQEDFDKTWFLGQWYVMKTSPTVLPGNSIYLTAIQNYFINVDGNMETAYIGYLDSLSLCLKPGSVVFEETSPGEFTFSTESGRGFFKILYTDYNYAVTYSCRQTDTQGKCIQQLRHVSILSRKSAMTQDKLLSLQENAWTACVNTSKLKTTSTGLCRIPEEFLNGARGNGKDPCQFSNIPIHENFDMSKFVGAWNSIWSTPDVHSNDTYISTTYNFFLNAEDEVVMVSRGYKSSSEKCVEPVVQPMQEISPGNYLLKDGEGQMKIVFTDYTNTVLYLCTQLDVNQHCAEGKSSVSILSRDHTISKTVFNSLQKYITLLKICSNREKLVESYSGLCLLSEQYLQSVGYSGPISDQCNGIINHQQVDLAKLSGEWYLIQTNQLHLEQKNILSSKGPVLWDLKENGYKSFYRMWNKTSGGCLKTYVNNMNEQSSSGHYGFLTEHHRVSLKILYTDTKDMITFLCYEELNGNGNCPTENIIIEVRSRSENISIGRLRYLKRVVAAACLETNSLVFVESGFCPVPATVINVVRDGQVEQNHAAVGCRLDYLPVEKHFNVSMIVGEWNIQYSTKEGFNIPGFSRGPFHFVAHENLTVLYRRLSRDDSMCKPTEAKWYMGTDIPGSYTFEFADLKGYFTILSLDESMLLLYYCLDLNDEGSCTDGMAYIQILTRTKTILPDLDIAAIKVKIQDVCLDPASLVKITNGTCPIPNHIIETASLENIPSDSFKIGCQVKNIPHQHISDVEKMSGEWYTIYTTTRFKFDNINSKGPWRWVSMNNGFVLLWSNVENENNKCNPIEAVYFTEKTEAGDYTFKMHLTSDVFKILYTDYEVIVAFRCSLVDEDGFCAEEHRKLNIYSRTPDISEIKYKQLLQHIIDACIDLKTVYKIAEVFCPVPEDYVLPTAQGKLITEGYEIIGCRVEHFPVQKYFDLSRFNGRWFIVSASKDLFYDDQTSTGPAHIVQYGTGLVYISTRYNKTSGKCLPSEAYYLEQDAKPGNYKYTLPKKGSFKVLFTDYTHAVVHICLNMKSNGDCQQNETLIKIMSHSQNISSSVLLSLKKYIDRACMDSSEVKTITNANCPVSKGIIEAAENGLITKGYELVGCKTKYFSVPENFDESKVLSGTWNIIWSTPLPMQVTSYWTTYKQWTFVTGGDTKLRLKRGFKTKTCGPTLSSTIISNPEHDAYIFEMEGIQGYFKALYMDYINGVGYYCLKHKPDGSCEENFAIVVIISRHTDISEQEIIPLKKYLSHSCMGNVEFQRIKGKICPIPELILQAVNDGKITEAGKIGCKMDFIVPQSKFNESQVTGTWNYIWNSKIVDLVEDGLGPIQFLPSASGLSFVWRYYNETTGTCKPTSVLKMSKTSTPGEYISNDDGNKQVVKFLFMDSVDLILYVCVKVQDDGYCSENKAYVELDSRNLKPSTDVLSRLRQFASDVCINPNSLLQNSVQNCQVPANIIKAAKDDIFSEGFHTVGCLTEYVPSQENVDMSQFTGDNEWFTLLRSTSMFTEKPPSHKSKIIQTSNGELFMLSRSYRSSHMACEPTEVLKLTERSGPGDYTFSLGGNVKWNRATVSVTEPICRAHHYATAMDSLGPNETSMAVMLKVGLARRFATTEIVRIEGIFRILYADENYAVTYTCFDSTPGVVCPADFLLVEVLSKKKVISDLTLKSLQAYINDGCIDASTLSKTMPELCQIPDNVVKAVEDIDFEYSIPIIGCNDKIINHERNLDSSNITGIWHVQVQPSAMFGQPMGDSQTVHISLVTDGIVVLWQDFMSRTNDEEEMCQTTRASYLLQRAGPGDYIAIANHFTVVYKILYADSMHMVTYLCVGLNPNGMCTNGHMAVNILSRETEVDMATINGLMKHFEGTCASVDSVITTTPDLCSIPQDIIDAAEVGNITSEYTFVGCSIDFIKTQSVPVSELTGSRNVIIRPQMLMGRVLDHSKTVSVYDLGGGNAMMLSVTYNSTSRMCYSVEQFKLNSTGKLGEFTVSYLGKKGIVKLLYADKNESVWYTCFGTEADGLCKTGMSIFEIWTRNPTVHTTKLNQLKKYAASVCSIVGKKSPPAPCVIPENIKKAAASGSLTLDYALTSFKTRFIPVQDNFQTPQILGSWNVMYKTAFADFLNGSESIVFHFLMVPGDRLAMLSTSKSQSAGRCIPVEMRVLTESAIPGTYVYPLENKQGGTLKFVFTDYSNVAVLYLCMEIGHDGICKRNKLEVNVLSRTTDLTALTGLEKHIRSCSVNSEDLHKVKADGQCSVSLAIQTAAQKGTFTTDHSQVGCHMDFISALPVEMSQIEGLWTVILRYSSSLPKSVYITKRVDGSLVYLSVTYNSTSRTCNPVQSLKLEEISHGNFKGTKNGKPLYFKVLYRDDTALVTYTCFETNKDGTCNTDMVQLEILSRADVGADSSIMKLMKSAVTVCLNDSALIKIESAQCVIPSGIIEAARNGEINSDYVEASCMHQFIPVQQNFDPEKFAGNWNTVQRFGNWINITSISSYFVTNSQRGLTEVYSAFDETNKQCTPAKLRTCTENEEPGNYTFTEAETTGVLKIIYTDNVTAVVYYCLEVHTDGTCHKDKLIITVLARAEQISIVRMTELLPFVKLGCASFHNQLFKGGSCTILSKIKEAADKGELTEDNKSVGCQIDFMKREPIELTDLQGHWNAIIIPDRRLGKLGDPSLMIHFEVTDNRTGYCIFGSYNPKTNTCRPLEAIKLHRHSYGQWSFSARGFHGQAIVQYLDSTDLVFYFCGDTTKYGTCRSGLDHFYILSRQKSIPDQKLSMLMKYAVSSCSTIQNSTVRTIAPCFVPDAMITAAKRNEIIGDYVTVSCQTKFIPVHPNFDFDKFAGTWHVHQETRNMFNVAPWVSQIKQYIHTSDGKKAVVMRGFWNSSTGCTPTDITALTEASHPGDYIQSSSVGTINLRILYTDYTHAVEYMCFGTRPDGTCKKEYLHVQIISKLLTIPKETLKVLRRFAVKGCIEEDDLHDMIIGICSVPEAVSAAAAHENVKTFSQIGCKVDFISTQQPFDIQKLVGVWHTVMRYKMDTSISTIRNIAHINNGSLAMAIRTYIYDERNYYTKNIRVILNNRDFNGNFEIEYNNKIGYFKVLGIFDNMAVLYICAAKDENGICKPDSLKVDVLTRDPKVDLASLPDYGPFLTSACISPSDLIPTYTGLFDVPEIEPVKAIPQSIQPTQCVVDEIETIAKFDLIQMSGHWYELARTRFTFNKMESVVIHYNYNYTSHMLNSVYTGTINGECQTPPLTSLTKNDPREKQAAVLGRIGGLKSNYPWLSFKILFFDGRFLMVYVCYEKQPDGTCNPEKTEVNLLGRTTTKSKLIEHLIPKLMKDVCLSKFELIDTKREVDCTRELFTEPVPNCDTILPTDLMKKCSPLSAISVAKNFRESDILGHWVGAAFADLQNPDKGRNGFLVTVSRNSPNSLKMVIKWRNDPEMTVILKQRCRGSGYYISTYGSTKMQQWSSVKIVNANLNDVLMYWCTKELEGSCLSSGARVDVLTRSYIIDKAELNTITNGIKDDCFPSEKFVQTADVEEYYNKFISEAPFVSGEPVLSASPCTVDNLPTVNIDLNRISGYWYEIAKNPGGSIKMDSFVCNYLPTGNGSLKFIFSGKGPTGKCITMNGNMQPRCPTSPDGNFLGRINRPGLWSWTTWKVLYTDYAYSTVAMSCSDEDQNGTCSLKGTKVHILSRTTSLDPGLRTIIDNHIRAACLNPANFISSNQDGSCQATLAAYVRELQEKLSR